MPNRYHLYQKQRGKDYAYIDRVIRDQIEMGGCLLNLYKWLGSYKPDGTFLPIEDGIVSDSVLNENSHRKYSHTTIDIYGAMQMNAAQFSFNFGGYSVLDGDEKEITFHYNSMIDMVGRKIIVNDVLEMTWFRDNDLIGSDKSVNKFYVVTSADVDEKGWDPHWGYHLWKIKCKPLTNTVEFQDLFNDDTFGPQGGEDGFYENPNANEGGGGFDDANTNDEGLQYENDENLKIAEDMVAFREYNEHHLLLDNLKVIVDKDGNKFIYGLDGIPVNKNINGVPFGTYFPDASEYEDGDYFLRIDFDPPRLYKRIDNEQRRGWQPWEFDRRPKWLGAPDKLRKFLNDDSKFVNEEGETVSVRQEMDNLVKARVHKEGNKPDGMPDYKRPWTRKIADELGVEKVIGNINGNNE